MHVDELAGRVGQELGLTDWVTVDQARIDRFADAIDDHQWIHVDPERAASGPYGVTIAHGYLTLSMLSIFLEPILDFDGLAMRLNYGIDRIRFPHHVPVGSRLRARVTLESVDEIERGVRVGLACVLEIDGVGKPACVAHPIALLVRAAPS
ncbi:MAG: MaoC family dehydratase [Solirubrobacterales bacterium]|nr:MaoC family dehydratase [Solirubrobacterales bacterium]